MADWLVSTTDENTRISVSDEAMVVTEFVKVTRTKNTYTVFST